MVLRRDLGLPVRLDHDGLMRLDDEGRARDAMAWLETGAQEDRRVVPSATGEEPRRRLRFGNLVDRERHVRLVRMVATAKRLDLDRLDLDRFVRAGKAEALPVHRLERGLELDEGADRHGQCAVGAEIAEMREHADADAGAWHTLALQLRLRIVGEGRGQSFRRSKSLRIEQAQHGAAPCGFQLCEPHAVGRQDAGQRMDEHADDAKRVGDEAGMLPTRAAEGIEHIVGDVVAALHRDGLDRVRHVLDRDADEAVGHLC